MNLKAKIWWLAGGLLSVYIAATCFVTVNEHEYAVITQFGRPVKTITEAGLAVKLPNPVQAVTPLEKRVQMLRLEPSEYSTRDRRNIVVDNYVVWRIVDPVVFLTSTRTTEIAQQRLNTITNSQVGAMLASYPLDSILNVDSEQNQLDKLFQQVSERVDKVSRQELGIEVLAVRAVKFGYSPRNLKAIYDRMSSEWERLSKQYRAQGHEEAEKIRARTEQEIAELKSTAYRDSQIIKGNSEARAAELYSQAFESHQEFFEFVRTMEAYKAVLDNNSRLVLPSDSDLFEQLVNPKLDVKDES
ncbi:protease modulator HflC [Endozoicomonas gorgoniicola]|uniref:Protein HflC n=1 Tax=Endozoicomonas gorgoniicola TaxID=1234144 RepID=A0ABT3MXS9_9GAMM|nr:protease modulator HflC [Endozoicomonas gorgoniicola]MCW7554176.1 protease modulator HflC [Endozoicomonas gorgoniicola]